MNSSGAGRGHGSADVAQVGASNIQNIQSIQKVQKRRRDESPDVTEALRSTRAKNHNTHTHTNGGSGGGTNKKGGSEGSSSSGCSGSSSEEEEEEGKGHSSTSSSTSSGRMDILENSLSDFPPELDFMGGGGSDKTKRRTDRYDSSESSDSGVATLSPSTSDSTELTSPFSPCCDLSSDASSTISASSSSTSSCGDPPSSPECPRSASPPPVLHPVTLTLPPQQPQQHTILLGHPIMTALSLGDSNVGSQKVIPAVVTSASLASTKLSVSTINSNNNNGIISFQIPNTNLSNNHNHMTSSPSAAPFYNNPISKLATTGTKATKVTKVIPLLPKVTSNSCKTTNSSCDVIRPLSTTGLSASSPATAPLARSPTKTSALTSNRRNSNSKSNGPAIKNIFATALNFHQKQQQQQKEKLECSSSSSINVKTNSKNNSSSSSCNNTNKNNNNNNSTTINKNHPQPQQQTDLMNKSPLNTTAIVKLPTNLRGSGHQSNKVIHLSVALPGSKSPRSKSPGSKVTLTPTPPAQADLQASQIIKKSLHLITSNINKNNNTANITGNHNNSKIVVINNAPNDLLTQVQGQCQGQGKSSKADLPSPSSAKKARLTTKHVKVITAEILGAALKINNDNAAASLKNSSIGLNSSISIGANSTDSSPGTGPKKTEKSPESSSAGKSSAGTTNLQLLDSSAPTAVLLNFDELLTTPTKAKSDNTNNTSTNSNKKPSPLSLLPIKSSRDSLTSMTLSPQSHHQSKSTIESPTSTTVRNRKRKIKSESGNISKFNSLELTETRNSISSTSTSFDFDTSILTSSTIVDIMGPSISLKKSVVSKSSASASVGVTLASPLSICLAAAGQSASSFSINGSVVGALLNPVIVVAEGGCMWKDCKSTTVDLCHNILEHIQTVHVESQEKTEGYHCLWEGCKVYDKKSSSLSWLVRHVLSHSGNKPFKCIFPGCGQSFGTQGALERHVNSHISTYGTASHASSMAKSKLDNSPMKAARRKKQRCRKQRVNPGQYVDYFDKRVMEVIKHRLASSMDLHTANAHDCTFRGEVVARRTVLQQGPQVLVHWYPESVIPDEWVPQKDFSKSKLVPLSRIQKDKLVLLYPTLLPPPRQEKASRKCRPRTLTGSPTSKLPGSISPFSMLSSSTPSPSSSTVSSTESIISSTESTLSDFSSVMTKSEMSMKMEADDLLDEGIAHCSRKGSSKKQQQNSNSSTSLGKSSGSLLGTLSNKVEYSDEGLDDGEADWVMDLLTVELRSS